MRSAEGARQYVPADRPEHRESREELEHLRALCVDLQRERDEMAGRIGLDFERIVYLRTELRAVREQLGREREAAAWSRDA
jgi:hypothetical protein